MSITRINEFRAKDRSADALRAFLTRLIPTIAAIPGCQSCQLLQHHDEPTRFIVLEVWESIEAHQASVKDIPPESLAAVMTLLDERPTGVYYCLTPARTIPPTNNYRALRTNTFRRSYPASSWFCLNCVMEECMLPSAAPKSLGLDPERLRRAFALLQGWLDDDVVTAVAAAVIRQGQVAGTFYGGAVSTAGDAPSVTASSLFHLASIGKPMTALAVMLLVEEGRIALDDPVEAILPEFAGAEREGITTRHLLSHTSGLAQDADLSDVPSGADTATELRSYLRARPVVPIGSKVEYSNVGYGLLGLIIEAVSGQDFATFMRERLFQPAGMESAYLAPPEEIAPRIVHVAGTLDPGGPYERFNSAHARRQTHPAGQVLGSPLDVAQFFHVFLDRGRAGAVQLASPATVQLMTTSQTDGLRGGIEGFMTWDDCTWGLGFDLRGLKRPHFSGEYSSPGTFGHTGVAGTFAWADPATDLVCVMLANRMLYNRWNTSRWSRFSTAVASTVVD